jgi:tetratricopeptide (TPR) repeat protein
MESAGKSPLRFSWLILIVVIYGGLIGAASFLFKSIFAAPRDRPGVTEQTFVAKQNDDQPTAAVAKDTTNLYEKKVVAPAATLDSLQQRALAAENRGDWLQAVAALQELHFLMPHDRTVMSRFLKAYDKLNRATTSGAISRSDKKRRLFPLLLGGSLATFTLVGFLAFSPKVRVRYHLWYRDYAAAARFYERILERHPGRVKHYSALATIYLLQGRRDDQAMKLYKTVLQLNLAVHGRERINSIVGGKYLTETDSDAMKVLKKALQRRLQQRPIPEKG